jgi:hypothetical protein
MTAMVGELVTELKLLRKGRGILVNQLGERVGPALRSVCAVSDGDDTAEIRRKVSNRLRKLADYLPDDLRVAVLAAFALDPEARLPFFQERVRWAANQLSRDERTARRRIDDGISQLAELAATSDDTVLRTIRSAGPAWYTEELRVCVALDQPTPESFEVRRIVANRDNLREIDLALTLTGDGSARPSGLEIDVFFGGELTHRRMEASDRYGFVLTLPEPLDQGDKHEFALRFRVPPGQEMQPHFVCVPQHRCDLFDLRVRFAPGTIPRAAWRLSDAFQRDVSDPVPHGHNVPVDQAGELHQRFEHLTPGKASGVRWDSTSANDVPVGW